MSKRIRIIFTIPPSFLPCRAQDANRSTVTYSGHTCQDRQYLSGSIFTKKPTCFLICPIQVEKFNFRIMLISSNSHADNDHEGKMDSSLHKSGFVNVNGIRLHYLDWGGSGPVLLFLAGIGNNAHIFDGFAPRFTDQFHVLALTRRGHGESDYPETGYDIDTLTDDIRLFLDSLYIDRAILVQHTNEGIELPHFAALFPDRVQKLVFLEPVWDRNSPMFKSMMETWSKIEENVQFPDECWDNFDDYVYQHNKNFPVNSVSWCEARAADLRNQMMIGPDGKIAYKSSGVSKARKTMDKYTPEFARIQSPVLSIFPIRDETYYVLPFMTEAQKKQMIEFYYSAQLPWFNHCIKRFRHDVPYGQVVELSHSNTYFFITQEDFVYKEMKTFLQDS